jgi:hypothetical protein
MLHDDLKFRELGGLIPTPSPAEPLISHVVSKNAMLATGQWPTHWATTVEPRDDRALIAGPGPAKGPDQVPRHKRPMPDGKRTGHHPSTEHDPSVVRRLIGASGHVACDDPFLRTRLERTSILSVRRFP